MSMSTDADTETRPSGKGPVISFRLKSEDERQILVQKAHQAQRKLSDFLRRCVLNVTIDQGKIIADLVEDFGFMFQIFQRNAEKLSIKPAETERVKLILTKIKELKKNEPR